MRHPGAEICQNNSRKNCGKDLNSTLWFALEKKLREGPQFHPMVRTLLLSAGPSPEPRLLTFSDQKILCRIPRYSLELRCYSVMNEITVTPVVNESKTPPKLSESEKAHRICSGVKVVCTVAVAVLAAGRTGPAAPGSERADRLHLPHVRCTALPAQCSHAEWCGARCM